MTISTTYKVRCRGIILHEGKLLVVTHPHREHVQVLPGGHVEVGEDLYSALTRELIEELGVAPEIGPLQYVHSFTDAFGSASVEFIFLIKNSQDYLTCAALERSHAAELSSIRFIAASDTCALLPVGVADDFKAGTLGQFATRYLHDGMFVKTL
jgi:8-oxo-dGTP pyrophosphatase MutT (NUDIX family)